MVQSLKRLPDWRARFAREMDRQRRLPFSWEAGHDCTLGLAAGAVIALTGVDLAAEWRDRFATPSAALAEMRSRGFGSIGDMLATMLPEIHPDAARIGDIGTIPGEGETGQALCVVDTSALIVMTARGHGRAPRELMLRAFKVG